MAGLLADATSDPAAYERLALWLLDANAEEIAALWAGIPRTALLARDTSDMFFVFWTRLDPEAAIAAAAGTDFAPHAWRAWAANDPGRALEETQLRAPERLHDVAYAIGKYHPQWLREHPEEMPGSVRHAAMSAVFSFMEGRDPFEELELAEEKGMFSYGSVYEAARRDPMAAWSWIKGRRSGIDDEYLLQVALVLQERHPEALQTILLEPEAAELKRVVDEERFRRLLQDDPAAARHEAESTTDARAGTSRLTAVGLQLVRNHPEAAFGLVQRMFELNPDALFDRPPRPGDWEGSRAKNEETHRLMTALIAYDPERVLSLVPASDTFGKSSLCGTWAAWDSAEYANWINSKAEPEFRDQAAGILIGQLTQEDNHAAAAEWYLSLQKPSKYPLQHFYHEWRRSNPFASEAWLDRAEFPESMKAEIRAPIREGGG